MVTRTLSLLGMRVSLFASGRRAGLEMSVPIAALRRGGIDVEQQPVAARWHG